MHQDSTQRSGRKWFDTSHASLCVLGAYLQRSGFFRVLEAAIRIRQKVLQDTPAQKLQMLFVALLAGAKAVSHTGLTLRVDRALQVACGLPGCAEQSVIADTLDAATEPDVADLRHAGEMLFAQHRQARQHAFEREGLVLDLDRSPLPASPRAEGCERGYMGRSRSTTGRKLVRVRAAASQETVWEEVLPGRTVETLEVLHQAVEATERLLGLEGDTPEAQAKRARTEWRLDRAWGSEEDCTWLLGRGDQVTAKFRSTARVKQRVAPIANWQPTSSAGREVAEVPAPVAFVRPTHQYAVRTPSEEQPGGSSSALVGTSRLELDRQQVVAHDDARAGMEADLKSDQRGLGLAVLRKRQLAAQTLVVLLVGLAHNVLVWARRWLSQGARRLASLGIVRLVQEVWAIPGRVKLTPEGPRRVRLRRAHPRAREVCRALRPFLGPSETLALWG